MGLMKKSAAHQQEMGLLSDVMKKDKDGIYNTKMINEAMKMGFVTDEFGKADPSKFNPEYEAGSIQKLLDDPMFKNEEAMMDRFVKAEGEGLATRLSSHKEALSKEFFDQEDKFQYNKAVYGDELTFDDNGRPLIKDAKEFMLDLKSNDPEAFAVLDQRAKSDGVSVLSKVEDYLSRQGLTEKGSTRTKISVPNPRVSAADKTVSFSVVEGGSGEFSQGTRNFQADSIPMTGLVKNMTIEGVKVGEPKSLGSADFEGFYINPENGEPSFKFSTSDSNMSRRLEGIYKSIDDEETIAKIRNVLTEGSPKRIAFEKAFIEGKTLKSRDIGISREGASGVIDELVATVKNGNFDIAKTMLGELTSESTGSPETAMTADDLGSESTGQGGVSGVEFIKNTFNSNEIVIDGTKYYTKSDSAKIKEALLKKILNK
jgi:hypothetical protein